MLWLFSILLALLVHAVGLILIEPSQPSLPSPNAFSEEVVVMLGQGSGSISESIQSVNQPDTVTRPDLPAEAETDQLAAAVHQPEIEPRKVEDTVAAPLERGQEEPEEAPGTAVIDADSTLVPPDQAEIEIQESGADAPSPSELKADVPDSAVRNSAPTEQVTALPDPGAPEAGTSVPRLAARDVEAADTVALETAAPEPDPVLPDPEAPAVPDSAVSVPDAADTVSIAVVPDEQLPEQAVSEPSAPRSTSVVPTRPISVEIARPGSESTTVVAPAQLVDDARLADPPEAVDVEETPDAGAEDTVIPAPDAVPEQVRIEDDRETEAEPVDEYDDSAPLEAQTAGVEEAVSGDTLAAVVLEFETVEATTAAPTQAPDPNTATLVSIEEQIARALTVDESQSSGLGMGVVAKYAGLLKGRLEESMHYPRAARLAGQQGNVVVRFVIDRNGTVLSIVLEKPSGHSILDREAVEMIERAEPFPTMPGEMSGEVLELRVPIAYKIDESSRTRDIPPIYLD